MGDNILTALITLQVQGSTTVAGTTTISNIATSIADATTLTETTTVSTAVSRFYMLGSGGNANGQYAVPSPTAGQVLFDNSTPQIPFYLDANCYLYPGSGAYAGRVCQQTLYGTVICNTDEPGSETTCQLTTDVPPQLVCTVNGNIGNYADAQEREWSVGSDPYNYPSFVIKAIAAL